MSPAELRLAHARPGDTLTFRGFDASVLTVQQDQLLGYGLAPGRVITVLQTRPIVVLACDETELAIEAAVAAGMIVGPA